MNLELVLVMLFLGLLMAVAGAAIAVRELHRYLETLVHSLERTLTMRHREHVALRREVAQLRRPETKPEAVTAEMLPRAIARRRA